MQLKYPSTGAHIYIQLGNYFYRCSVWFSYPCSAAFSAYWWLHSRCQHSSRPSTAMFYMGFWNIRRPNRCSPLPTSIALCAFASCLLSCYILKSFSCGIERFSFIVRPTVNENLSILQTKRQKDVHGGQVNSHFELPPPNWNDCLIEF